MKHYINLAGCDRLRDGETIQLINLSNENIIAEFTQNDIDIANNALRFGDHNSIMQRQSINHYNISEDELKTLLLNGNFVEAIDRYCFDYCGKACVDFLYKDEVANKFITEYTENPNSINIDLTFAKINVVKTLNILINGLFNEHGVRAEIRQMTKKYHMLRIDIDKSIIRNDYNATTRLLSRLVDTISKHCYVHSEIKLY